MNRELRKRLCKAPIIDTEGNINHEYFADIPGAHWSEHDQERLMQGIQGYGIGNFDKICKNVLPDKSIIEIKLQTCMLLGAHNIEEFKGIKDTRKIAEIKSNNLATAKKCGKLKYGIFLN